MLYSWQKKVEKYIPKDIEGYDYACTIPVYVPIRVFNVTILERQTENLPFIYECLMSAVSIEHMTIDELSQQFGVENSIMLQMVSQLDMSQMVMTSGENVKLTDRGVEYLKRQKMVKIVKKDLRPLYLNQITGEITDEKPAGYYRILDSKDVYLEGLYEADLQNVRAQFDQVSFLYEQNQVSKAIFNSDQGKVELYRIIDVIQKELVYIKDSCCIYVNREDRSLRFEFTSQNKRYAEVLKDQFLNGNLGASKMDSRGKYLKAAYGSINDFQTPRQLVDAVLKPTAKAERYANMEEAYYADRTLLDGELEDIFYNCNCFNPDTIMIETPWLSDFNTEWYIAAANIPSVSTIILRSNGNDRSANYTMDKMHNRLSGRKNLTMKRSVTQGLLMTTIIIGSECMIEGQYCPIDNNTCAGLLRFCSRITFEKNCIREKWEHYFKSCGELD